jgi:hypothetical protein
MDLKRDFKNFTKQNSPEHCFYEIAHTQKLIPNIASLIHKVRKLKDEKDKNLKLLSNELSSALISILKTKDGVLSFCRNYEKSLEIINSLYHESDHFDYDPLSSVHESYDSNHLALLISFQIHSFLLLDSLFENQENLALLTEVIQSSIGKDALISSLSINNAYDEILKIKDSHFMLKLFVSLLKEENSISLFLNSKLDFSSIYTNVPFDLSRSREEILSSGLPFEILKNKGVCVLFHSMCFSMMNFSNSFVQMQTS